MESSVSTRLPALLPNRLGAPLEGVARESIFAPSLSLPYVPSGVVDRCAGHRSDHELLSGDQMEPGLQYQGQTLLDGRRRGAGTPVLCGRSLR